MFACIMVDKWSLDMLDDERALLEAGLDIDGCTWVWIVPRYTGERTTRVGISYILSRAWQRLDIRSFSG